MRSFGIKLTPQFLCTFTTTIRFYLRKFKYIHSTIVVSTVANIKCTLIKAGTFLATTLSTLTPFITKILVMLQPTQSRHHRCPKSKGGSDFPPNTIRVKHSHHEAWHTLFGNKSPQEIVDDLNNIWFYPEYEVTLVKKGKKVNFLL